MNPDQWCNYRVLQALVQSKNEYSKRIIVINMDTEIDRIQEIIKDSIPSDWFDESRVETERILGKILGNDQAFDQAMQRKHVAENQLQHLMDEELYEEIDDNNNIIYKKIKK